MSDTKNELETLLEKAATEPAHRPAFFSALLEATVWVLSGLPSSPNRWLISRGVNSLPLGSFGLRNNDSPSVIAISVRAGIITKACSSATACCSASSEVKNGITEVPSSFSQCCRSSALSSTICSPSAALPGTQTVLEGGEALLLSEVAEPPAQMVDSLTTLFKTLKTVKRAFLCSIKERADAPANLLIGIEAEGDIEAIIQTTGSVATDTLPGDEPIDICQVVEGEKGISHFMIAHITPFYEKRWGSFLRDFKQNRII